MPPSESVNNKRRADDGEAAPDGVAATRHKFSEEDVAWIDATIETLMKDGNARGPFPLTMQDVNKVCTYGILALKDDDPNPCLVDSPVAVCGGLKGNFAAARNVIASAKSKMTTKSGAPVKVLFLGGYGNGDSQPIHAICFLLLMKARYPTTYYLLQGIHEWSEFNKRMNGPEPTLAQACAKCFGDDDGELVWSSFNRVFEFMAVYAIVDKKYFCSYAGVVPHMDRVDLRMDDRDYSTSAKLFFRDRPHDEKEDHHDAAIEEEAGTDASPIGKRKASQGVVVAKSFLDRSHLSAVVQVDDKHSTPWGCTFAPNEASPVVITLTPSNDGYTTSILLVDGGEDVDSPVLSIVPVPDMLVGRRSNNPLIVWLRRAAKMAW